MEKILGIVIAASIGLFATARIVEHGQRVRAQHVAQQAWSHAVQIADAVRQVYSMRNGFSGMPGASGSSQPSTSTTAGNCILINAGVAPPELIASVANCTIADEWGGAITTQVNWSGGNNYPGRVNVELSLAPLAACLFISTQKIFSACITNAGGTNCYSGGATTAQALNACAASNTLDLAF